jgi:hypothetical protein
MSCVVVARQDVIDRRPQALQVLVDGIARSGLWLDEGRSHREHAADFVGRYYFNQPPELLRHALTQPLDRVVYTRLSPRKPDFDMVRDLMIQTGVLDRKIEFEEYVDVRASTPVCWKVVAKSNHTVPATTEPQLYRASVVVTGDGITELDRRRVFFLVPPIPADIPIN